MLTWLFSRLIKEILSFSCILASFLEDKNVCLMDFCGRIGDLCDLFIWGWIYWCLSGTYFYYAIEFILCLSWRFSVLFEIIYQFFLCSSKRSCLLFFLNNFIEFFLCLSGKFCVLFFFFYYFINFFLVLERYIKIFH